MKIQLGRKYLSRDKKIFEITRILGSKEYGYEHGYRFAGQTIQINEFSSITHTILFSENGMHAREGHCISTPSDLVEIVNEKAEPVHITDVSTGTVSGRIEGGCVMSGPFTGWIVESDFLTKWGLISSITGSSFPMERLFILSMDSCDNGYIEKVLVIYRSSLHSYYRVLVKPTQNETVE